MNFSSWAKLPVKQQVSLFAICVVAINYLLYTFLLEPEWAHIAELKTQYKLEQQKVTVIEDFVLAHPNLEGYLFEVDTKIMEVDKMLPDNPDVSSFLLQAEQLATECGVQLSYLKPGKIDNKQGYREIVVEISVKGNYFGIMNFLHKTESGSRLISIANISMQLGANGLESKMLARIYSHGVPAPHATASNPPVVKK